MRIKNSPDLSVIQFEISLYSETPEKAPVKELIRSEIVPQIRDRLQKLGPALIAEHGKDLQHTPGSETEFRTTASELYNTFTDPQRITAFTRSTPLVFDGAKPGGRFELFGGNVNGEYTELEEPKKIVQKWRLAQWPQGHYSTLRIKFEQNDVDGVTLMRVDWEGVPVGQEEVTKRNWGEYYVRSIKITFGFGTVL